MVNPFKYSNKVLPVIIMFLIAHINTFSQDIHFSQFYMAPLNLNPAMAGSMHDLQANLVSREQWRSVGKSFRTAAASFDMRLNPKKRAESGYWAWGLNVFNDRAGDGNLRVNQANLNLAYHLILDENNSLGAGFQGGFAQRSIHFGNLQWGNQFDGQRYNSSLPTGEQELPASRTFADMGAGLVWVFNPRYKDYGRKTNKAFKASAGVAVFHINRPDYSFTGSQEKLFLKQVFHSNMEIALDEFYSVLPGFVYTRQGPAQSIYAGSMFRYRIKQASQITGINAGSSLALGGFIRLRDAVSVAMLYEYGNYAIGFNYDINTSPVNTVSYGRGGWEVSLRFLK